MSRAVITKSLLTAIADAIRAKTGGSAALTPAQMAEEITNIPSGNDQLPAWLDGSATNITYTGAYLTQHAMYRRGYNKNNAYDANLAITLNAPNLIEVGANAFERCLISVINAPKLTTLGVNAFISARFVGMNTYNFLALTQIKSATFQSAALYQSWSCASLLRFPLVNEIQSSAFESCGITKISQTDDTFPEKGAIAVYAPMLTNIGNYAFRGCRGLCNVYLPYVTSIGDFAFFDCSSLTMLDLPALLEVPTAMVQNCNALQTIKLRDVTSIQSSAFQYASGLKALVLDIGENTNLPALANTNAFTGTPIASGTGFIYVPDGRVEECQAATNWAAFAAQIKPISEYTEE